MLNSFALIVLSALILRFVLHLVADTLNLRALRSTLPAELQGLYDEAQYRKSQDYTRARTKFGLIESTFDLVLLLIFWFAGGFQYLDQWVRGFGFSSVWTGVMYIGILALASSLLGLPFALYSTFVIEERFGFNKTTLRTFILDRLKAMLLGALLGIPLLAAVLWFFESTGPYAWIYCWLAVTAFGLIVQFIAPVWIMPLFNKFKPLESGDLRTAIFDYADRVKFSVKDIFVMDGSKRSSKANAFFTGFGNNKRIALFDTLLEQTTTPEMVSVLAHEIGHYKMKHIFQMMIIGILQTGILLFLLSLFIRTKGLFDAFFVQEMSTYAGLIFFALLYEPVSMILSIAMSAISRRNEFSADKYAVNTTPEPEHMVNALKKLSLRNLSNLTPHPFYVFLHYSHPPLLQRIEAIRLSAAK